MDLIKIAQIKIAFDAFDNWIVLAITEVINAQCAPAWWDLKKSSDGDVLTAMLRSCIYVIGQHVYIVCLEREIWSFMIHQLTFLIESMSGARSALITSLIISLGRVPRLMSFSQESFGWNNIYVWVILIQRLLKATDEKIIAVLMKKQHWKSLPYQQLNLVFSFSLVWEALWMNSQQRLVPKIWNLAHETDWIFLNHFPAPTQACSLRWRDAITVFKNNVAFYQGQSMNLETNQLNFITRYINVAKM